MDTMDLEIKRLEEFYGLYKSPKCDAFWQEQIVEWYEGLLSKLYTQKSKQSTQRKATDDMLILAPHLSTTETLPPHPLF